MTIFQIRDHTYDMIKGGYHSPTYRPKLEMIPEPTHKLASERYRYSVENIDFESIAKNDLIDLDSLTFCVKTGETEDAVQVYSSGIDAFRDTIQGISGIKTKINGHDISDKPKIVFSANCKEIGYLFGSMELSDWDNYTDIEGLNVEILFEGSPRQEIIEKYDRVFSEFGLPKPKTVQNCNSQSELLSIKQKVNLSDRGTTDGLEILDEKLLTIVGDITPTGSKDSKGIKGLFDIASTEENTDKIDLQVVFNNAPELYTRLARTSLEDADLSDGTVFQENISILYRPVGEVFYGHSECRVSEDDL